MIGVHSPWPHCGVNTSTSPHGFSPSLSKLQGHWVERGGGERGSRARLLFGSGGTLVNHFDWIKVSEALNNVRGQSGWIKCLCQGPGRVTGRAQGLLIGLSKGEVSHFICFD